MHLRDIGRINASSLPGERAVQERESQTIDDLFFDDAAAMKQFGKILADFLSRRRQDPTVEAELPWRKYVPANIIPGGAEHKLFLFFAAATDMREVSGRVYEAHRSLWLSERIGLFLDAGIPPSRALYDEDACRFPPMVFATHFAGRAIGNRNRTVLRWPVWSHTIWNVCGGDPTLLFMSGGISELMEAKKKSDLLIPGIGPKILSLMAVYFEELGMDAVHDAFPVDVHIQRLALALRIVRPRTLEPILNETMEELLRPRIAVLCDKMGWSRIDLSSALWSHGNSLCGGCWENPHTKILCPVFESCQGAYWSRPYFRSGLWLPHLGPLAKGGRCPTLLSGAVFFGESGL